MPNSNVTAQLTIQDLDLLSPGLPALVKNSIGSSLTFSSSGGVIYGGYQTITLSTTLFTAPPNAVFLYVRNVTQGGNNGVDVNFQVTGQVVTNVVLLAPGGMLLVANNVTSITGNNNAVTINNVVIAPVLPNNTVTFEFLYAY